MSKYKTDQESFWSGEFGDDYIERNKSKELLASNLHFFAKIFNNINNINNIFEVGCNIGMNLQAIQMLLPNSELNGVEINKSAAEFAQKIENVNSIINDSVLNVAPQLRFDFVFTKGVLIHINPGELEDLYSKMAMLSSRYVLIAEYYNPFPVNILYRGHKDKLFKRDFAGEFLKLHPEFKLVNYSFHYKKDNNFSQDDITWFLMERI
jgi:pseudaminic acid biosynthesis-associated methylase